MATDTETKPKKKPSGPPLRQGRMRSAQTQPDKPPPPDDDADDPAAAAAAAPAPEADETMPPDLGPPPGGGPPALGLPFGGGAGLAPPMGGMMGGGAGPGPMDFLAALGGAPGGGPGGPALGRMPRDAEAPSSPLLDMLAGSIAPPGGIGGGMGIDPYATGPMPTNLNTGSQDPNAGVQNLLALLALGMSGAAGQPGLGQPRGRAGISGVDEGQYPIGTAPFYSDLPPRVRY